jgi:tetratricopeptide (TPR) repeat protein
VFSIPAAAEVNTLNIRCLDSSGKPVSGARIQLYHLNTNKAKDKKSDGKGFAGFNKLEDGVYRVVARREGFAPSFYEYVLLKNSAEQSIDLAFAAGSPDQVLHFEDAAIGQRAFEAMGQGLDALRNSKFDEAEKLLVGAAELQPSHPELLTYLAIAYLQQKKWDLADATLKKAVTISSMLKEASPSGAGQPNPYVEVQGRAEGLLGKIPVMRLRIEGDQALAARQFDEAIAKYREALKLDATDPDGYYNLALAEANARKYDDAIKSIEKALQLKPTERAYLDLKRQIEDHRQNAIIVQAREIATQGDDLYNKSDFAGALKKYEEAVGMIPEQNQAGVYLQIGRTYAKLQNSESAVKAFKRAIELAPQNTAYRKALADYFMAEKKYEEALNLYADSSAAGTERADQNLVALGQKLSSQGNSEVAALAFEKALQANPQNVEVHYDLGMLYYYSKKDDKRAKELLTKYLEIGKDKDRLGNARTVLVVIQRRSP